MTQEQINQVVREWHAKNRDDPQDMLIISGFAGCVDAETEYFNGYEWVKISNYQKNHGVLQYNPEGTAEVVTPSKYIKLPSSKLYHFENRNLNQTLSLDHDVVYKIKNKLYKKNMKDLIDVHNKSKRGFSGSFLTTFNFSSTRGVPLQDDMIKLIVAVSAEGHYASLTTNRVIIGLKHTYKKNRLEKLLSNLCIPYKKKDISHQKGKQGYHKYTFYTPFGRIKAFPQEFYHFTAKQKDMFIKEVVKWDGSEVEGRSKNNHIYRSSIKDNIDMVQFFWHSIGYHSNIHKDTRKEKTYYSVIKSSIRGKKFRLVTKEDKLPIMETPTKDGYKYCFTVPSGMLILRRENKIFITGNCGKTFQAKKIPDLLDLNAVFITPTGKAARVLHDSAMTIHSYRYSPTEDEYGDIKFVKKDKDMCEGELLIIDEISMVNEDMMQDLRELGKPMIGLGDPAQLPPVKGTNEILENPDIFLTKVWRNDGGILEVSKDVRETGYYILGKDYKNVRIKPLGTYDRDIPKLMSLEDIIILTKFNKTRRSINRKIREEVKGFTNPIHLGERLICLKNNKDQGIMNGMTFTVVEILKKFKYSNAMYVKVRVDGEDGSRRLLLDIDIITGKTDKVKQSFPKKIKMLPRSKRSKRSTTCIEVDYAYAITVHKAQGSEFKYVAVINEGMGIGDHQKWLYTGVTRAKEGLLIYD